MFANRFTVHVPDHAEAVFGSEHYSPAMTEAYRLATHQVPAMKPASAWVIDHDTGERVYEWSC